MSKRRKKDKRNIIPVIIPDDLRTKVGDLSVKLGLSRADIMRLSIERGLGAVEKMFEKPAETAA